MKNQFHADIRRVNAEDVFLSALEGVTEPEKKRKIIAALKAQACKNVIGKNPDVGDFHKDSLAFLDICRTDRMVKTYR